MRKILLILLFGFAGHIQAQFNSYYRTVDSTSTLNRVNGAITRGTLIKTSTTGFYEVNDNVNRLLPTLQPVVVVYEDSGRYVMRIEGIEYFHINRGGDITFHGPQQLVGYPILDLEKFKTDLGWYLRSLEEVIILTMAEYGLTGDRSPGETGVWLDPSVKGKERKICAMGIKCSRWITMHGFAFNVNTDLSYFDFIIPCGIGNKKVTSLKKELGRDVPMDEVKDKVRKNFEKIFDCALVESLNAS